ncbi:MAG: hypothetical protein H7842_04810 [Gammaproteobacteria bacterium SHHR-1]
MSTGQLYLCPAEPDLLLPAEPLLDLLQALQLCAEPLSGRDQAYAVGTDFMHWISFTGCSPLIRFSPESDQDRDFCHLRLHRISGPRPQFLYASNSRPPACPQCRKGLSGWLPLMQRWQLDGSALACPHCASHIDPRRLNWQRQAGMGRTLLEIFNIFPGEARPLPGLLEQLGKHHSGQAWRYFYLQGTEPLAEIQG